MGSRHASQDPAAASNAFSCNFANTGHRISIQLSNLCAMCKKKAILKITFNIRWNLKQFGVRGTPGYQRVTSKGSRAIGSEWPDKRDKTEFGSVARVGGFFSRGHPPQLNSLGYGVVWVTGLFSLCDMNCNMIVKNELTDMISVNSFFTSMLQFISPKTTHYLSLMTKMV